MDPELPRTIQEFYRTKELSSGIQWGSGEQVEWEEEDVE